MSQVGRSRPREQDHGRRDGVLAASSGTAQDVAGGEGVMLLASTKPEVASLLCQMRKLLLNSSIRQSEQVPVLEIFMDHCRLRGSQNILLLPSAMEVRQSQLPIQGDFSMDPPAPSLGHAQDSPGPADTGSHASATARAVSEMHSPFQQLQTHTSSVQ